MDLSCDVNPLALLASVEVAGAELLLRLNQFLGELRPAQPVKPMAAIPINANHEVDNLKPGLQAMAMAP